MICKGRRSNSKESIKAFKSSTDSFISCRWIHLISADASTELSDFAAMTSASFPQAMLSESKRFETVFNARRIFTLSNEYPKCLFSGLKAEVIVVVRLTFEVWGVVSAADSEGSENNEVSPPRIVSGLCGVSSKPSDARNPGTHFHRCPCFGMLLVELSGISTVVRKT